MDMVLYWKYHTESTCCILTELVLYYISVMNYSDSIVQFFFFHLAVMSIEEYLLFLCEHMCSKLRTVKTILQVLTSGEVVVTFPQ